jgi:hypothetical protein
MSMTQASQVRRPPAAPARGAASRSQSGAVGAGPRTRSATLDTVSETSKIRVLHCNSSGDGWTADSPDLAGWRVTGASYEESRARAEEAVRAQLDRDVEISHHIACSRG